MVLYVDDRENDLVKHKLIARMGDKRVKPDGMVEIKRLPVADYIMGEWGIEAKEINDLYHSILGHGRSRTIVGQLHDLQEAFEKPILVVYGTQLKPYVRKGGAQARAFEMSKMKRVIKSFKQDFLMRFPKIQYMEVNSMDDFVDYVVNMHTKLRVVGQANMKNDLRGLKSRSPSADPRIACLTALPGITERISKDLLDKFGSIPNLLRARRKQSELMEVKGVGRRKAKLILSLRDKLVS
jgi:ERCC4-type nuclease